MIRGAFRKIFRTSKLQLLNLRKFKWLVMIGRLILVAFNTSPKSLIITVTLIFTIQNIIRPCICKTVASRVKLNLRIFFYILSKTIIFISDTGKARTCFDRIKISQIFLSTMFELPSTFNFISFVQRVINKLFQFFKFQLLLLN